MTRSPAVLAALALGASLAAPVRAQPANDACANAIQVVPSSAGTSVSGTTTGATPDGGTSCVTSTSADVWYSFTLTNTTYISAELCGGSSWDTLLSVHSGCPGTASNTIFCNDDSCGLQSRTGGTLGAGTFYVRVAGYSASYAGTFTLTLTTGNAPPGLTNGPDVITGEVYDVGYFGQVGDILAYAIGTDACNAGNQTVPWTTASNHHPVIAQNFYRLKAGRFEQIGQSWLKHGFAAANGSTCFTCQGGGGGLGPGCSDIYSSGLNGTQGAGPRSQVNATNGVFPYPFNPTPPAAQATIGRRLQVKYADMDPAQNAGASYYAEAHYVTPDDAQFSAAGATGNGLNNASWRRITFTTPNSAPTFAGATHRTQPAIFAWQAADPAVVISAADYIDNGLTARFWVAGRVTDNADGTWTYEYAVHNLNSDRSGGSFSVPLPAGAVVTNPGFHGVFSHSGEPYENTATNPANWPAAVSAGAITWACTPYATNVNANAVRWGTLYNFRFTANVAPASSGSATIGLFKPATTGSPATSVNASVPTPGRGCGAADFDHDGNAGTDADIEAFFACIAGRCCAACDPHGADFDGDGDVATDGDIEAFFRVLAGGSC